MADNVNSGPGGDSVIPVATDVVTNSGDANKNVQIFRDCEVSGAEGSKVTQSIGGNSTPAVTAYSRFVREPVVSHNHFVAAASTNAAVVKASAGTLKGVSIFNVAGYPIYVKYHNAATTPTAGTGVVLTVACQAGTRIDFVVPRGGRAFSTGIARTVVQGITDADNTAVALSDAVIEEWFE